MTFRVEQDADRAFRLVGELDLATVEVLMQRLGPVADRPGDLNLDAADLSFVDSTGLHGLVKLARKLGPHGRVIIHHVRPFVRHVIEIAGLDRDQGLLLSPDRAGDGGDP